MSELKEARGETFELVDTILFLTLFSHGGGQEGPESAIGIDHRPSPGNGSSRCWVESLAPILVGWVPRPAYAKSPLLPRSARGKRALVPSPQADALFIAFLDRQVSTLLDIELHIGACPAPVPHLIA